MMFLLDPREFQELALMGLELPGVDLLLLTLVLLGLGRDAEYDLTLRLDESSFGKQVT